MNRCKPAKMDTKECDEGRAPAKNARGWKIEGQKKKRTREACKSWEVSWRKTGLCITTKRMLDHRGAVPREDVDLPSENQAMHEERFLSSWLREDVEGKNE